MKILGQDRGSIVLMVSEDQAFAHTFSFKVILTSRRSGEITPGVPLDSIAISPATGKYLSEMDWKERPDTHWVFGFVRRHFRAL